LLSSSQNLAYLSATEQLDGFRNRVLSPVDVLRAQIDRIETRGAAINAITYKHFDPALDAAHEAERRYRKGEPRPLEGISVAEG